MQFVSKLTHHNPTKIHKLSSRSYTSLRPFTVSKSVKTTVTRDWFVSAFLMKPNHIKPQRVEVSVQTYILCTLKHQGDTSAA